MCWELSWEAAWPRPVIGWSAADLGLWLADQSGRPPISTVGANHQWVIESISNHGVAPHWSDRRHVTQAREAAAMAEIKSDSSIAPIVSLLLSVLVIL